MSNEALSQQDHQTSFSTLRPTPRAPLVQKALPTEPQPAWRAPILLLKQSA